MDEKKELSKLVRLVQRGDLEAFGALYDRFFDPVFAYVFRQVGSTADTEDIVSGVFIEAFEKIGGFTWRGAGLAAWLFRIAHHDVLDYFRRQGRSKEVALFENPGEPAGMSLEETATRRWEEQELREAVDNLSEEQRQVVLLKLMFDFSNRQIADVVNKSEGAVKALRHRALLSLRKFLEAEEQNRNHDLKQDG